MKQESQHLMRSWFVAVPSGCPIRFTTGASYGHGKVIETSGLVRRAGVYSATLLAGLVVLASPHVMAADPRAPTTAPSVSEPAATVPSGSETPVKGVLRVQVVDSIDDGSLIPEWITQRNPRLLDQLPAAMGHEQWIAVEIGGATYDYWISVTPMRDGKPVGLAVRPHLCECNSEQLLAMVDNGIAAAVARLRSVEVEPAIIFSEVDDTDEDAGPVVPEPPKARRRRLSGVGVGGVVLTGLGAAVLGGGVAMVMKESTNVPDRSSLERYWRPPGYTALAAGGSLLLAGTSMVIVGAIRCHQRRVSSRCGSRDAERLEIAPMIGARHLGVSVARKF
jgi:hypothetical protein